VNLELFDDPPGTRVQLGEGAWVLRGFALPFVERVLPRIDEIAEVAPFRHMITPGGFTMSAALTNCGALGWTSDANGYRYSTIDPLSGRAWPAMPAVFRELAEDAAREVGFAEFAPDSCLLNRYVPEARMTLHQDKNERDLSAPIVSVSLGLPITFLWGGMQRSEKTTRVLLRHGDVAVWGGVDRLRFHGVMPLAEGSHPLLGRQRINFTFRKAG
jgi:alkylated DNA repair protein (DNA oxidative demethylase)